MAPGIPKNVCSVACVFLFAGVCPSSLAAELSGTPDELRGYLRSETRTVTIRDEATELAYSDIAKVTLVVSTKAKMLADAMQENNEIRDSIVRTLVDGGVESDDIQSSKYSASPQFGWFGSAPNNFEVVNTLVVTVDSEAAFRRIAEISDQEDSVRFGGAEFEHSQKEAYKDRVRDKAMDAVMQDRAYFEEKLGLKLRPLTFSFSDVGFGRDNGFGYALEEIVVTGARSTSSLGAEPAISSSFDEIEYRVTVEVTFEVESRDESG